VTTPYHYKQAPARASATRAVWRRAGRRRDVARHQRRNTLGGIAVVRRSPSTQPASPSWFADRTQPAAYALCAFACFALGCYDHTAVSFLRGCRRTLHAYSRHALSHETLTTRATGTSRTPERCYEPRLCAKRLAAPYVCTLPNSVGAAPRCGRHLLLSYLWFADVRCDILFRTLRAGSPPDCRARHGSSSVSPSLFDYL